MKVFVKKHGFVLVVVLAILAMLTLVGIAFVSVSRMETEAARNYLDDQRGKFVAESGIYHGLSRLQQLLAGPGGLGSTAAREWIYWGNNNVETGTPDSAYFLKDATNPSFAYENESPQNHEDGTIAPKLITIQGASRGFSGFMDQSTYGRYSDIYSLKVVDVAGQLYINEGMYNGVSHPYNTVVIKRILNNLGSQAAVGIPTLGDKIISGRPAGGYKDKYDLVKTNVLTQTEYDKVKDYLSVYAWLDDKVVNPVPLSNNVTQAYATELLDTRPKQGGVPITRLGRGKTYNDGANAAPITFYESATYYNRAPLNTTVANATLFGWDELSPQYIEVTSRAPVNVNTASRPVLVALLKGLEGFFIFEQKRGFMEKMYSSAEGFSMPYFFSGVHEYIYQGNPNKVDSWLGSSANGRMNDGEIGVIFRTAPITDTMAEAVADAIIAYRTSTPFTTWTQFEALIDGLVRPSPFSDTTKPLNDGRTWSSFCVYNDYGIVGSGGLSFDVYRYEANRALADVIKSNFNPNLHLNEINPNADLRRHVDKTDLIVNSAEFCFTSHGVFEIESLGRVLRPEGSPDGSAWSASNNIVMAEKTVSVVVKLFDVYRETNQSDFYNGTFSDNLSSIPTNNNYALTSAPEVDNGPAAYDNRYEGYIHLALYGGSFAAAGGTHKPKYDPAKASTHADNLWRTSSSGSASCGLTKAATMHSHLDFDFNLHHSTAAGKNSPLTENYTTLWNWQDPPASGDDTSPYCAAYNPGVYRIAYPYTWTGSAPTKAKFAPSDLRVDGAFSERHSALVYHSQGGNFNSAKGMMAYWLKPNFIPEITGKVRIFGDIKRYNNFDGVSVNPRYVYNPSNFTHYYFPAQWRYEGGWRIDDSVGVRHCRVNNDSLYDWNCKMCYGDEWGCPNWCCWCGDSYDYFCAYMYAPLERTNPASMGFGFGYTSPICPTEVPFINVGGTLYADGIEGGVVTRSLNHRAHGHATTDARYETKLKEEWMRANRWMHIALVWDMNPGGGPSAWEETKRVWRIYINGVDHGTAAYPSKVIAHYNTYLLAPAPVLDFTRDCAGTINPLRFGEHSRPKGGVKYTENFSADSTFDEIYVFNDTPQKDLNLAGDLTGKLWGRGRYYRWGPMLEPTPAPTFTSKSIDLLSSSSSRSLPTPSSISPPGEEILPPPEPATASAPLLLGVSWTAYTSGIYRYSQIWTEPTLLSPAIRVAVSMDNGTAWGSNSTSDSWTPVYQPITTNVRYRVTFDPNLPDPWNDILLETPVFDDITLYYAKGTPEFLSWRMY